VSSVIWESAEYAAVAEHLRQLHEPTFGLRAASRRIRRTVCRR